MRVDYFVTGASGFIGSHLCNELTKKYTVVAQIRDIYPTPWGQWLQEALRNCVLVKGDVLDFQFVKRVMTEYSPQKGVVHLAAQALVATAQKDPMSTFQINVQGTVHVLEAARQLQTPRLLINSTDKVYGDNTQATVNSKLVPTEPYGTSKICMDLIAQTYRQTYGIPITVTRPSNVYGYDFCSGRIIPNTIKKCIRGENPFIYKDEASVRQYVFIEDVCEIIEDLLTVETAPAIVNIASNTIRTQQEVVLEILKNFPGIAPEYVEKPNLREIHSQCMTEFLKAKKPIEFTEGIRKTIEAFRKYGGDGF